jgi:hypothetical protein
MPDKLGRAQHEDQTMNVENTAEAPKKKANDSPTKRALAECKKRGWIAQVVERWNQYAKVRQDLFGVIDIVALVPPSEAEPGYILGIQACAGPSHAARRTKIAEEPRTAKWKEAGGKIAVWSFAQRGERGARKLWTLREEAV